MQLKEWLLLTRLWILDQISRLMGLSYSTAAMENENNSLRMYNAYLNDKVEKYKEIVRERDATIARLDQKHSLDVRSSLDLINFDNMGEIVWIKVADDRMLRYDVFNQIRDWMRSHGKEHTILMVTGTNVTFDSLTEADLEQAQLRRLTPEEREQSFAR